ncbi:MAG: YdeI/OmpD-associated family protein [Phycisphaerae bacterium]|nr:MAG: DUF1905 domain-containing protein [Planctomycetota bacterium]KAB2949409.1 MAG: DUF1905 domain-containing protein [Phycisphaerae bacterium]MBE7458354.1 DUF1905 domain-containing protein [Planctomycetia bacterium]MCK6465168.1 YdeI/OmpD-associated family protein [Phycisphaerae bacterium]MCL4718837.1 YdeI/OmpD-associated family protein [Phycisphaerae bacterium]
MTKAASAVDRSAESKTASGIRFTARLLRPKVPGRPVSWTFLTLPRDASAKLPSRGQVTVEGTINGHPFQATLEPDGQGGHWLKVDRSLFKADRKRLKEERDALQAGRKPREAPGRESGELPQPLAKAGDVVTLEIAPVAEEPEPKVPADLRKALTAAPKGSPGKPGAREAWADITPAARRDFIHWITSPKKPETRAKRIAAACDMLAKGKRRPCCFDRSGMYDKSLSCPVADDDSTDDGR